MSGRQDRCERPRLQQTPAGAGICENPLDGGSDCTLEGGTETSSDAFLGKMRLTRSERRNRRLQTGEGPATAAGRVPHSPAADACRTSSLDSDGTGFFPYEKFLRLCKTRTAQGYGRRALGIPRVKPVCPHRMLT